MENVRNTKTEICYHCHEGNSCFILENTPCNGTKTSCHFYKTKEKFERDSDASIITCRERGLCDKCSYMKVPCKTTTEM